MMLKKGICILLTVCLLVIITGCKKVESSSSAPAGIEDESQAAKFTIEAVE